MIIIDDLRVRKVTVVTGIISTVTGNGTYTYIRGSKLARSASIGVPTDIAYDMAGNLLITDL